METFKFEQFFRSSADLMAILDGHGNFVQVNPAFHAILGWDPETLIGQPYSNLLHPDDLGRTAGIFEPVDGVTPSDVELDLRELCSDNSYRWMRWRVLKDGESYYAAGRDITLRRETFNALAISQDKARAIFDAAVDSIIVIDTNLTVVEASPSNVSFAFSRQETEGRMALDFVHPDDQGTILEELERVFTNDEVMNVRFRGLHKDGQWRTIESRGRALRDAEGNATGAVIISRDISESVEAERALQLAKEEAELANVAKSEFMSRMSHELRTPLNSVLGFAQILQMEMEVPDQLEMISYIVKSGGYLLELINEVLDISRVESGSMAVSLELVTVKSLVGDCIEALSEDAASSGVAIIDRCDTGPQVRADPQHLRQIVMNLLTNAIKYNHAGGTVTLACREDGGRVHLSVTDTGSGIAPELHERVFAPFDRLDAESKGIEGTGLGLALSKGLAEAIGGSLWVESTSGIGSTFWLDLPRATTEANFADKRPEAATPTKANADQSATVLYVEDNIGNVRLMERLLAHRPNIRLITTLQGRRGVELAQLNQPDLILLDVHMPDLSGFEVLERLHADERTMSIPVVMLSADASHEQIERFSDAGARDYLTKPLDLNHFLTQLDQYLLIEDQRSDATPS